jgi:hypothetical protein
VPTQVPRTLGNTTEPVHTNLPQLLVAARPAWTVPQAVGLTTARRLE